MSRQELPSPWTAGLKAVRDNSIPLVIILGFATALTVSYYRVDFVRTGLDRIGALNTRSPLLFAALWSSFSAGLVPWCFRMAFPRIRPRHPLPDLVHCLIWWALMGMLISGFYSLQARWFGEEVTLRAVSLKVAVDMLGFTVFIGAPLQAISHLWKDYGWDTARLRAAMGPGWYRRLVLPNLLPNYCVWLPGTFIFYSLPTSLQLVVANCIGCFWALMCARIAAHSGVPTTDIHA